MATITFRRGKLPPKIDARTLMFSKYLKPEIPPAPASVDYYKAVQTWPMMGNDTLGDCTCAAAGHMIQEWTAASTGAGRVIPDKDIVAFYRFFSPAPQDNGADMLTVLKTWRKRGIVQDKIQAFVKLAPRNNQEVMQSVDLFGSCYIGVALPDSVVPENADLVSIPWIVPASGPVGNAAPNPNNGHCIPAVGYDQNNLYVVTWGTLKTMSWDFYSAYSDEAYGVLSTDFIEKTGKAPNGFDLAALQNDLNAITS